MKSSAYIEAPPMPGAKPYVCPACQSRTMLVGVIPPGMVVRRRCDCKQHKADGTTERTMVEITSAGARVVKPGEPDIEGMIEFRCEYCKRLLCKYIPAAGGAFSVKCWRNSRCMRKNTLTCVESAGEKRVVA